jgi:hypothetical protein
VQLRLFLFINFLRSMPSLMLPHLVTDEALLLIWLAEQMQSFTCDQIGHV